MGGEAGPFQGYRFCGQGGISVPGDAGHQVGGRIKRGSGRRLDLRNGGDHIRGVAETGLRKCGIERVELVHGSVAGSEISGNGEMGRCTALGKGSGPEQGRSHPGAIYGIGHTDGIALGPFNGFPGPCGTGFGSKGGEDQAAGGCLRAFLAAAQGGEGCKSQEKKILHG